MNRKPLITVVEHDPQLGALLLEVLTEAGYATELWTERAGAFECIRQTQPDLVILDLPNTTRAGEPSIGAGGHTLHILESSLEPAR